MSSNGRNRKNDNPKTRNYNISPQNKELDCINGGKITQYYVTVDNSNDSKRRVRNNQDYFTEENPNYSITVKNNQHYFTEESSNDGERGVKNSQHYFMEEDSNYWKKGVKNNQHYFTEEDSNDGKKGVKNNQDYFTEESSNDGKKGVKNNQHYFTEESSNDGKRGVKNNQHCFTEENSNDFELYKEYVQWDFINNVLYNIGSRILKIPFKFEKEFTNTLQRWFIYINEHFNEVPKYSYYPILPKISIDHTAAQFLKSAFVEKKFADNVNAGLAVEDILHLIENHHSEVKPHQDQPPIIIKYDSSNQIIIIDKFQSPIIPRLELLIKKAGLVASAKMLLRYEAFGNGSYQWGDPKKVHKVLYKKFNVRYEGFASPVNSRFIEYNDTYFCSLFPETDGIFGSLGNFFHVDMVQHKGGWSVNPPFLNDLMKKVAERIIEVLDNNYEGYFFCTFPCWIDDVGWQMLNTSRHLRRRFDLKPQHFIVQDAYGKTFKPNMSMNMFQMGDLPTNVAKLTELGNILIMDNHGALPEVCNW